MKKLTAKREMSDDELDAAAGGCCSDHVCNDHVCNAYCDEYEEEFNSLPWHVPFYYWLNDDHETSALFVAEAASYPANRQSLASPVAPYGTYRSGIKKNTSIRWKRTELRCFSLFLPVGLQPSFSSIVIAAVPERLSIRVVGADDDMSIKVRRTLWTIIAESDREV